MKFLSWVEGILSGLDCNILHSYLHIMLWQKNLLTIFHTEKHFKIRKEHFLIKLNISLTCHIFYIARIWENLITKKKHLFADVLESGCSWKFCKIIRKTPVLESLFNRVANIRRAHHKCFPMKCFFLITPQNQTMLQLKQFFGVKPSLFLEVQRSYFGKTARFL